MNATALNGLSNLSNYKIASVPSANSFTLTIHLEMPLHMVEVMEVL